MKALIRAAAKKCFLRGRITKKIDYLLKLGRKNSRPLSSGRGGGFRDLKGPLGR